MTRPFDPDSFLAHLPHKPGIYIMKDAQGALLYVGKANNLKKRVSSYFQKQHTNQRVAHCVAQIADIEITVTQSNAEALLLEASLIKSHQPKYNVLLKDDKSHPVLCFSHDPFPRLFTCRSPAPKNATVFGPYLSKQAVEDAQNTLHHLFQLRSCPNTMFANRSRPCLEHQIKRCSAPCVGKIAQEQYAESVAEAQASLKGHSNDSLLAHWSQRMQEASQTQNYEEASLLRDRIARLRALQETQRIVGRQTAADVFVHAHNQEHHVVHVLRIREHRIVASENHGPYPMWIDDASEAWCTDFVMRYEHQAMAQCPPLIVTNIPLSFDILKQAFQQHPEHPKTPQCHTPKSSEEKGWVALGLESALALLRHAEATVTPYKAQWQALEALLGRTFTSIHAFDVSHHHGQSTLGACVAFGAEGPEKSAYRIYPMEHLKNDDCGAMRALFVRYLEEHAQLPDLLVIDGGQAQCQAVLEVFDQAGRQPPWVLGMAKGPARKVGVEHFFFYQDGVCQELCLPPHDKRRLMPQRVRDEAHRVAGRHQRKRNLKKSLGNPLDAVVGLGEGKKKQVLAFFGGMQGLMKASQKLIAQAPGIGPVLAQRIYQQLHPNA